MVHRWRCKAAEGVSVPVNAALYIRLMKYSLFFVHEDIGAMAATAKAKALGAPDVT